MLIPLVACLGCFHEDSHKILGPYSRTSYDISQASDWSRWPSRPIRSQRYIVTCTRIRAQKLSICGRHIVECMWNK